MKKTSRYWDTLYTVSEKGGNFKTRKIFSYSELLYIKIGEKTLLYSHLVRLRYCRNNIVRVHTYTVLFRLVRPRTIKLASFS